MLENDNDSSLLKEICEDTLFRLIMLNEKYAKMLNARPANLHMRANEITFDGDCADCAMNDLVDYHIQVCLVNDKWQIKGENGITYHSSDLQRVRQKIAEQELFIKQKPQMDSMLAVLNTFFEGVDLYFRTKDESKLRESADAATVAAVKRVYQFAIKKYGKDAIQDELLKPKYVTYDLELEYDNLKCIPYNKPQNQAILMELHDGQYVVSGLLNTPSSQLTSDVSVIRDLLVNMKVVREIAMQNGEF